MADNIQQNATDKKRKNRLGKRQRDRMKRKREAQETQETGQLAVDRYLYLREDMTGVTTPDGGFILSGVNGRISANDLSNSGANIQWLISSGFLGEDAQPARPIQGLTI